MIDRGVPNRLTAIPLALLALLAGPLCAQPPMEERVQVEPDMALQPYAEAIDAICSYAVSQAELAGLSLPNRIVVRAFQRADHHFPLATSYGSEMVFVTSYDHHLAPSRREPPLHEPFYKVRELMAAVIDMATDHQYPIVADMLSAMYLVPGLFAEYGTALWPQPYDYNDVEGAEEYVGRIQSPLLHEKCPDLELAAIALTVAEEHGPQVLCQALAKAISDEQPGKDAVQTLADALVEATGEDSLNDRFALYRERCEVQPGEDGSLLLYGFEQPGELDTWFAWLFTAEIVADHATQGQTCVALASPAGADTWASFRHQLPYWKYRDWSSFSGIAFDIYNASDMPEPLVVHLFDGRRRSHAKIEVILELEPKATTPVEFYFDALMPIPVPGLEDYFDGTFRFEDVYDIMFSRTPGAPGAVFYLDNLRLLP